MIDLERIREAAARIGDVALDTPLLHSRFLSDLTGADVWLKAENLQRTGSFKVRGATNRVQLLTPEERSRGVIAASAGNHAQGVALAAQALGVPCTICMAVDASLTKVESTRGYGARIELEGIAFDEAMANARGIAEREGSVFISPFDDEDIIAGQGTAGLEIIAALPDPDLIIVPCGGGGLISGVALAVHALRPETTIIGVQSEACSPFADSLAAGVIGSATSAGTIADGIAVKRPGNLTFPIVQEHVERIVTVDDEEIAAAMTLLSERHKLVVEGAGAAGVAALMTGVLGDVTGKRIVIVLSGGNIDLLLLQGIMRHGLTTAGRYMRFTTRMPDRPGSLRQFLDVLTAERVNIVDMFHHRDGTDLGVKDTAVDITVETKDHAHGEHVLVQIREAGYPAERMHLD
jgi:threonine dehydratase